MAQIDYSTKRITVKVVYYGPAQSGKTASLSFIFEKTRTGEARMATLGDPDHRADAYYEMLPLTLGEIRGFKTVFELFTVPGGDRYGATRQAILQSVDGVVFVADSRRERLPDNVTSMQELRDRVQVAGFRLDRLPLVVQCNHCDAPTAIAPTELARPLIDWHPDTEAVPVVPSIATTGVGVFEALKHVAKLVLSELRREP